MTRLDLHDAEDVAAWEAVGLDGLYFAHYVWKAIEALTDDDLDSLSVHLRDAIGKCMADKDQSDPRQAIYILIHPVVSERMRRAQLVANARITIEANGHEVWINYDAEAERQHGGGWSAHCHCEGPDTGQRLDREQAIEVAAEHAAEHGGRWGEGHPATRDYFEPDR